MKVPSVYGELAVDRGDRPRRAPPVGGREGGDQPAGRLDVAEQRGRDRVAALLAGQAGPQHRVDLVEPRHEHRGGGVDHHDRPAARRGDRLDQRVLRAGQAQRGLVDRLGLLLLGQPDDDDGDVGGRGGRGRVGDHLVRARAAPAGR